VNEILFYIKTKYVVSNSSMTQVF